MQRSLLVVIVLVIAVVLAGFWWFTDSPDSLPSDSAQITSSATDPQTDSGNADERTTDYERSVVANNSGSDESDDPYYQASLAGFRGRLVFEDETPAPHKSVELILVDAEVLDFADPLAQELRTPQFKTYETRSRQDGTFEISGVWPQLFCVMIADRGGDHQMFRTLPKMLGPGEVVDVGDVLLPSLGTLIGQAVDEDGTPIAEAIVRALDIPDYIVGHVPLEHFDPLGGVIISESNTRLAIVMPPYVQTAVDLLPIPNTRTNKKGEFLLNGVKPGPNVVLIQQRGREPRLEKGVVIEPGEKKDLGQLVMQDGATVDGVVVDTDDQPIVGAEVLVANHVDFFRYGLDFGSFAEKTDRQGRFSMPGMATDKVLVAVRRRPGDSWIVHGPSPVTGELTIKLKPRHAVTLKMSGATDRELEDVNIKLVSVASGLPGMLFGTLGMVPWVSLEDRLRKSDDGHFQIVDLDPGPYTIEVDALGYTTNSSTFTLSADLEHEILLEPAKRVEVQVIDERSEPIRNAKIYLSTQRTGGLGGWEMPVVAGKTDKDGTATIECASNEKVRVSATHPAFGTHHAEAQFCTDKPIVLRILPAGSITGILRENGETPPPGKYSLLFEATGQSDRGTLDPMPRLITLDQRGEFEIKDLRPGRYGFRATYTPGWHWQFVMMITANWNGPVFQEVDVPPGGSAHIEINRGRPAQIGASARVTGTVMLNGRPAKNRRITYRGPGGRIDDAGRFDLGRLKVGGCNLSINVNLQGGNGQGWFWSHSVKIEEDKDQHFDVTLDTGSISGFVTTADGDAAAGVRVIARGSISALRDRPKETSGCRLYGTTDSNGRYTLPTVPAGVYSITVVGKLGSAVVKDQTVKATLPLNGVNLKLQRVYTVSGKVDMSVYPKATGRMRVYVSLIDGDNGAGGYVADDGSFHLEGLPNGKYSVTVYSSAEDLDRKFHRNDLKAKVEVTSDTTAVWIQPVFQ